MVTTDSVSVRRRLSSVLGAYEKALTYANKREQFGRPIAEFEGLQWMMADMSIGLEAHAGRLLHSRLQTAAGRDGYLMVDDDLGRPDRHRDKSIVTFACQSSDVTEVQMGATRGSRTWLLSTWLLTTWRLNAWHLRTLGLGNASLIPGARAEGERHGSRQPSRHR
jgi:hypothetical protein